MRAEAIIIGDEILFGLVKEENSRIIINLLNKLGIYVSRIVIIRDDEKDIMHALEDALKSDSRIIITTGGLGPTSDDITLDTIAKYLKRKIVYKRELINKIRNCFAGKPPESAFKMARVIEGAKLFDSPLGLVPGQLIKYKDKFIIILPGPPQEVRTLLEKILEYIAESLGARYRCKRTIYVDAKEAEIAGLLIEVMKKFNVYAKAILTARSEKGLPVKILGFGNNENDCEARVNAAVKHIYQSTSSKK